MVASIYINPPYVAVTQTASIYGITLAPNQNVLTFGYIEQVNFNTVGYNVGDRILYPVNPANPIFFVNETQYNLVEENKIILREDITPPA